MVGWVQRLSGSSPLRFEVRLVDGDGPGDAGEFIGQGNGGDVDASSVFYLGDPLAQGIVVLVCGSDHGAGAMDEQASEIGVAPFSDAEQGGFAAGGMLSGHQPQRSGGMTAPAELVSMAHAGPPDTGHDRTEPRDG